MSDTEGNIDQDLSGRFLRILHDNLIEDAEQQDTTFDLDVFNTVKDRAIEYMSSIKNYREMAEQQRNEGMISVRRAAIEKTFEVKKRRAEARLEKAIDSRIIRMHQGEIRNIESKLQNAILELEARRQVSVAYEPIAYGIMELSTVNR